jgi:hypothetical protein
MFDDSQYRATMQTVLEAFGLGGFSRIARLGGTATPKFDVQTPGGRFVVRARSEEFSSENIVSFDHEVLRRLAAQGMPVPCPQKRPNGTTWLPMDGHAIEVLSWVEGEPFSWNDLELDAPANFRFPQPVRLHPWIPYFCYAPSVPDSFTIEPGKPYVSRYRFCVHDGKPDAQLLERLWRDYADPPKVRVVTGYDKNH